MTGVVHTGVECQQALERVLTYVGDHGAVMTADTCKQALHLVESALSEGGTDLPARCILRIPDYFERPSEVIPDASPPLKRGHIGYYQDG